MSTFLHILDSMAFQRRAVSKSIERQLTVDAGVRSLSQYNACPKFVENTDELMDKVIEAN